MKRAIIFFVILMITGLIFFSCSAGGSSSGSNSSSGTTTTVSKAQVRFVWLKSTGSGTMIGVSVSKNSNMTNAIISTVGLAPTNTPTSYYTIDTGNYYVSVDAYGSSVLFPLVKDKKYLVSVSVDMNTITITEE